MARPSNTEKGWTAAMAAEDSAVPVKTGFPAVEPQDAHAGVKEEGEKGAPFGPSAGLLGRPEANSEVGKAFTIPNLRKSLERRLTVGGPVRWDVVSLLERDGREPYLGRAEIASFMDVSERTIDRWAGEGLPHETWGLRTKKFLASVVVSWARGRVA